MKPSSASFQQAVRAFRDVTAEATDGEATRARVLAVAGRKIRRRVLWRQVWTTGAAILLVLMSGTAAWTAIGWWQSGPLAPSVSPRLVSESRPSAAPAKVPPFTAAPAPLSTEVHPSTDANAIASVRNKDESRAYAFGHRAHFVDQNPGKALSAWNHYLRLHPRGAFAPEARYNRAICLVRLGRLDEAAEALQPFARGVFAEYRQNEATRLLDWIALRP